MGFQALRVRPRTRKGSSRAPIATAISSRSTAVFTVRFPPICPLQCRLAVVATLTQALVVVWVDKLSPIPTVRLDVVNHCGTAAAPFLSALLAEWLTQELCRSEIICPDWLTVPAVILGALPSGVAPLRAVLVAPPITGQCVTTRMSTRSRRFARHSHYLQGQGNKKAGANNHASLR